ncbi:MAG TPA: glycoside hydrolase family 3 C-terminal domain-containing protein [Steroidobacteraceae bacterium]|nr:glycoside hydrolase family 3 C-terminal domain-containing protein [Steroidobacteraceae bacterium]
MNAIAKTARGIALLLLAATCAAHASDGRPWMNRALSPDERADLVLAQMTLDEKIQLVHGAGWGVLRPGDPVPPRSNLGAGFVPGIDRLGIPDINLSDSAVGVRLGALQSRYSTLLPSVLGAASSWDTELAFLYGSVIGRELRDQGHNMSLGGGVNLAREPRNGRNFEYAGEDPILAGTFVGHLVRGIQSQHVMSNLKHYAVNDQETGRTVANVIADPRTLRETDLLAFEIAIGIAQPAAIMCSYNLLNGDHACENDYLLNKVLKKDFKFPGFVLSDWGATHSTVQAALNGLDMEQAEDKYFGAPLKAAVEKGEVPAARLDDMVHRILRSMFAVGVIDEPPVRRVVDPFRGREEAQHVADESIVLLKNDANRLPLSTDIRSIALIGSHADVGVLSGGGSAQVDAPGGNAIDPKPGTAKWQVPVWFPSSPLKAIRAKAPNAHVEYHDGADHAAAAQVAAAADVAIVFVNQYMTEDYDAPTLSLPEGQDELVKAVAHANPRTIVVLETGGPVSMPWIDDVQSVLAAWYPGIGGAEALASIIFGTVNPSGHLPITFARSEADLPSPAIQGTSETADRKALRQFDLHLVEGTAVGYRWFTAKKKQPLFAFGHGLSYTTFAYSDLALDASRREVAFTVTNTGQRAGADVPQVYARLPRSSGEAFDRLVAWQRVQLAPGESKRVTLALEPRYLSVFDARKDGWELKRGTYAISVGHSAIDKSLSGTMRLQAARP